ncbi:hypothetical protein ACJX0J_032434, partial [Zea mays]
HPLPMVVAAPVQLNLDEGQDHLFPLPALLLIGLQFLKIGNDASEFVGPLVLNLLIMIQIHIGNMWYTCFIYGNSEIDSTRWRGENSMFSQNAAYKAVDKIIQICWHHTFNLSCIGTLLLSSNNGIWMMFFR